MYELNRTRLVSIGPRGARYTDVTLDFSDVGAVVATQGTLFGAPIRRPSPYSLLLLENGGGKSVLLKLLFSVVLPGKRNTVGASTGVMDKFVLGDDTAHVVLEWMHVRTGDRVITGKTLQRRRSAAAGDKLAEHWWSLRPHDGITIDTLPFTTDGRRLRLEGFRDALTEIDRTAPVTQLNWVGQEVGTWTQHLRDIGIEPELFAIQRRMNADEGDAANAFKFSSSKDFIEWLLKVVLDPDDATSVATNFDTYATTVGDRQALLLEQAFVAGTVDALRPAAAAVEQHRAARAAQQAAHDHAQSLRAAIRARIDVDTEAADHLRNEATESANAAGTRESERDRARDVTNEIRRQTLELELAAAKQQETDATTARDTAAAELRGWALADLLDRQLAADKLTSTLTERITQAEHAALPALHARDDAAGRLLRKLDAEATAARSERDQHNAAAGAHAQEASRLDEQRTAQLTAATDARTEHRVTSRAIAETTARVAAAITSGLLEAGDDVATAAASAADHATHAQEEVLAGERKLTTANASARTAASEARTAHETLSTARAEHQAAERALTAALNAAAPLLAADQVKTALGTEHVDIDMLDGNADALATQLDDDQERRDEQLATLRGLQREHQRLLDALGDGGLLPPRPEVDAALDVLHRAGIAAHAGWRYLADSVASADRAEVLAAHPDLTDGIVLVDAAQLPAAQAALNTAQLLPAAAVSVGTGARLLTIPPTPDIPSRFVVEPTPALFDADAAQHRRDEIHHAMDTRGREIGELSNTVEELRQLRTQLTLWQRTYPAGALLQLRAENAKADALLTDAVIADANARTAEEAAEDARERAEAALPELRTAERDAANRAGELARLAEAVAAADEQRRRLGELEETARTADRRAGELAEVRDREQAVGTEAARAAENAANRAEHHIAAMHDVATSTGAHADAVPAESVAELRATYQAAANAYDAVEVGRDLRTEADTAEAQAARLRAEVAGHDAADVACGRRLLASAQGADAANRQAGRARATREEQRQEAAIRAATQRVGERSSELRAATPSDNRNVWITLPEDRRPTSVEHGRSLHEAASTDQRAAQDKLDAAVRHNANVRTHLEHATEAVRAFREAQTPLNAVLDPSTAAPDGAEDTGTAPAIAPYDGDALTARDQAEQAIAAVRTTATDERDRHGEVVRLVDAVVRFASEPRFETMGNVAKRALVTLEREQVAARAGEFTASLEQRLASLTTELDSAARHRKLIVERLSALVEGALKTLRTASRLSKLPPGLGDWEGKEFLRIRFSEPDPSLLAARVGEVVDDIAATTSARAAGARGSAPKRDGLALLLRSIEAAVPKGFSVDVLKPDAVLRDERVPVEQMNEVFSGGQELTAAIVLYCTMAALHANERGRMRSRHSGVLFLDNPIGKASAEYLLELQQGVASALGVQLVYTTGLSDDRALAAFPLWVRMRNDADLRAGLKHIRVAEIVRQQLPDPFTPDEAAASEQAPGTVTATRVYRRPA